MRFIVYGVGAIGGVVAGALARSGQEVAGIARGSQLEAIRSDGLLLRTPEWAERIRLRMYADPSEFEARVDDVVLLTVKSQDTLGALHALRTAGFDRQPIVCAQNGVANERMALRLFPNVYGVTVMMPGDYRVAGEVTNTSGPKRGIFDLGRYPGGADEIAATIADGLERADIATFVSDAVMESKHGKLLLNLRNVIEAALGVGVDSERFYDIVRAEGEAAYVAAGIRWTDLGPNDQRRKELTHLQEVPGFNRSGGSSSQSLERGAGSIETDYMNGEIVLLGRLHGVPTPANAWLCGLGARLVRDRLKPGAITPEEIAAGYRSAGIAFGN